MPSLRTLLSLGLLSLLAVPTAAHAAKPPQGYIVMLKDPPISAYAGGTQGIPATSPRATLRELDSTSRAAISYRRYLDQRQSAVERAVPGVASRVRYSYRTAFAGFAARVDAAQAARLRRQPGVARVWKIDVRELEAASAPDPTDAGQVTTALGGSGAPFLGLTQPGKLWSQLGGANSAGEDIIVGVIDSGITPQHPSFADDPADGYLGLPYGSPPDSWNGICQAADDDSWQATDCNNKLIGARYYTDLITAPSGELMDIPGFLRSARDDDGHGTHTASTAAGNFGVDPVFMGNTLGVDRESGIAPRARIAAYKACWPNGCATSDLVKAIDDAVADGVDVINYSIGTTTTSVLSPDALAFLNASEAGVFVAAAAGNSGPAPGTIADPSTAPWVASVAAETLPREFMSTISFDGDPVTLENVTGASAGGAVASAPVIAAADAAATPGDPLAALCFDGTLDPTKVEGKIVVCSRGGPNRIATSLEVKNAGGVGEILVNAFDPDDLASYPFYLPTVTVSAADGEPILEAAQAGNLTASWTAGTATAVQGKVLAPFSGRGPQLAVPDIAKPDLTAPGVSVLAGNTPTPYAPNQVSAPDELYQSISGTSMASPHVAGAAALVTQAHPTLTTSEIKSALMLTADDTVQLPGDGGTASPFDQGSGHVDPTAAVNAGLVLPETTSNYVRYLGTQDPSLVTIDRKVQPVDLNLASIASSEVTGELSTVRAFKSIDAARTTWDISVNAPEGFTAAASRSSMTLAGGQTIGVRFTFTRTSAPINTWAFGDVTLTDGERTLRIPVSLRPITLKAPAVITITTDQAEGSQDVPLTSGFSGTVTGRGFGLAPADVKANQTVTTNTSPEPDLSGNSPSIRVYRYTVPSGSQLLETSISNVDGGATGANFDLFVVRDADEDGEFTSAEQVTSDTRAGAEKTLQLRFPEPGNYGIIIVGNVTKGPSTFDLSTWILSDSTADAPDGSTPGLSLDGDPLTVEPAQAEVLKANWARVLAKGSYRGLAAIDVGPPGSVKDAFALAVVRFEKTADTPAPTPSPTPSPSPMPSPSPTPSPTLTPSPVVTPSPSPVPSPTVVPRSKVSVTLTRASIRGRFLTVTMTLSKKARVGVLISRSGETVRHLSARTMRPGTRTVRIPITGRRLTRGWEYGVQLISGSASSEKLTIRAR